MRVVPVGDIFFMCEIELDNITKTFKVVKEALYQNIHIIDKIIENTKAVNKDIFSGIRQEIYYTLCQIENFLLYFLYNTLKEAKFKNQVEGCLTLVYHYRIKYSRFFSA